MKTKTQKAKSPKIKNAKAAVPALVPVEIKNEAQNMIRNGLSEAILGFNPGSCGTQLSQVDTLFANNRWYLVSNMRQILSEIYVEHGVVQTIVDVPVNDGLRGGVIVKSKQLSPENIELLMAKVEREDDVNTMGQGMKWNRLYGGAGVIVLTDQKADTPIDLKMITKDTPLEFRAVDMWELFNDKQSTEGMDETVNEHRIETYTYYGKKIHKSRVMIMKGLAAPSFVRPRLRGWGFSVVESLVRSINQYLKETNVAFEVLDEFKVDIYKINGLANALLSDEGSAAIQRRVRTANQQKNFQNAITMDKEDDYDHKQLSFAGLSDVMKEIRMQIACDMRMPMSKIFGISAAGLGSGEDDIENYNAMVESEIRQKCKYHILKMLEIRCMQMFGDIPDDLTIEFKPLRILSAVEEENVKTQKFARLLQAQQAQIIDVAAFVQACNKDNLLGVQIDAETIEIGEDNEAQEDEDNEPPKDQETENPGPAPVSNAGWEESKHPRADDGKFGSGGGGSEGSPGRGRSQKGQGR